MHEPVTVRSPMQHLKSTTAELRQRAGHTVPPPPSTWRQQPWPADGHSDGPPTAEATGASAPPLEFPTNDEDDGDQEYEWNAERLDLRDRVVNKDHAEHLHQLQMDVHLLQRHAFTSFGERAATRSKECTL